MSPKSCILGVGCPEKTSNCPQGGSWEKEGSVGEKVRQPHAESMALAAVIQLIVEINGPARGRGQEKTWGMNRVGCGIPLHLLPGLAQPYWVQSKRP